MYAAAVLAIGDLKLVEEADRKLTADNQDENLMNTANANPKKRTLPTVVKPPVKKRKHNLRSQCPSQKSLTLRQQSLH